MPGDRLSPLDASFLALEDDSAHMHVASVMLFDGKPPNYEDLLVGIDERLHLVPRYRQKLAFVPFNQGRPRWVDDPRLNLRYHVRYTALPDPATEAELRALAGRVFSQQLDRDKPLWELWLVEHVEGNRFAMLSKTHHALVDGISGVDIMSILFDTQPEPVTPPAPGKRWLPRPLPSSSELLGEAVLERLTVPAEVVGGMRELVSRPITAARGVRDALVGVGAMAWAGLTPAPPSPYNLPIGSHRRFTWVRASLADMKAVKNVLGGTVNDVVLATVAGALGRHLRRRGVDTEGLELRAMVPVSVRGDDAQGALGNQVAAMMATLPVRCEDPVTRLDLIHEEMQGLKEGGQAVGAQVITNLSGFAPPTLMSQAARLFSRQRFFNLVVTNVPGPQFPLYLMGREMVDMFPMVPLAGGQALGVAIMSYNGHMNFGLVGDYDAMSDIEELADDFRASLEDLADAADVKVKLERPKKPVRMTAGGGSRRPRGATRPGSRRGRRAADARNGGSSG